MRIFLIVGMALSAAPLSLLAQAPVADSLKTGKEIFEATCVGCHGPDGKGMREASRGFEAPPTFPDFSDCSTTNREPDDDWRSIIHRGGPIRGFSEIMPSFTEALRRDQIELVLQYVRGFCTDPSHPRGDMNFPKALITEKAFPEDEIVMTNSFNTKGLRSIGTTMVYEKRFGVRNQFEVAVPFSFNRQPSKSWLGGVGDMVLGYKRVVTARRKTGSILSVAGEVIFPTGNASRDLGKGVSIFETWAAFGQMLPRGSFLQIQTGAEFPTHNDNANRAAFFRAAIGKTFRQDQGFGRQWSPMLEFLSDREFATGEKTNWDIMPEMQVTLNKRHHIRFSAGVKLPANNRPGRSPEVMFYLLWDTFDGGLREGW